MNILHICSDYLNTSIYNNLLSSFKGKELNQVMYVPLNKNYCKKQNLKTIENMKLLLSNAYSRFDSYLYFSKIHKIYRDIKSKLDPTISTNLVHAHFLFSNGGVAYLLKKNEGINYIVAVRNTDVNYYFKYGVHLRKFGVKIMLNAEKVIFISPAYRDFVLNNYISNKYRSIIESKSIVIPNGIDKFWLENKRVENYKLQKRHINLLFVGNLNENKNIINSIKAIKILCNEGISINFDILGNGPLESRINEYIKKNKLDNYVKMHGFINDKKTLLKFYEKSNIFLVPSYLETFGLVYIEAISQGLPVIYSKGQGIDGFFKEGEVGYSVIPHQPQDIAQKIKLIIQNYEVITNGLSYKANNFDWNKIGDEYLKIYENVKTID